VTKELRITLRARNNRLIAARERLNLGAREAAAKIPVRYEQLLRFEGLKDSPINGKGVWRDTALRVAAYYGGTPEYFWPEAVMALVEPEKTVEIDAADVARLSSGSGGSLLALPSPDPDPEEALLRSLDMQRAREFLKTLPEREAHVLSLRCGIDCERELTYGQIGAMLNVSRERARQIGEKGLAMIRRALRA
jgi:RNA polymerase sigma factor (sigma-70 family)